MILSENTAEPRFGDAPQVKICGLTHPDQALACAELGADAIGCVFYPPSPRYVTDEQAAEICRRLPQHVCTVGVFVDETFVTIMHKVEHCGLQAVQLHGREDPDLTDKLMLEGLLVIKGLYVNKQPSIETADLYRVTAYLVECAGGALPGGNALQWDWSSAATICRRKPVILAGGLNPDNVAQAIRSALPAGVDVSSGVEAFAGIKDIDKVRTFLEAVARVSLPGSCYKVFPETRGKCLEV